MQFPQMAQIIFADFADIFLRYQRADQHNLREISAKEVLGFFPQITQIIFADNRRFFYKISEEIRNSLREGYPTFPPKNYMNENDISFLIRKAIFKVYNTLGPGLFESVYVNALLYELEQLGLTVKTEVPLPMMYEGIKFEAGFRIDMLINGLVIVEVKSIENIAEVHHKQVLTYLKLSGLKLGLLVNFNSAKIAESIFRKVNGL